jgi:hypothetical protein
MAGRTMPSCGILPTGTREGERERNEAFVAGPATLTEMTPLGHTDGAK